MRQRRVTIKDIASEAGVSIALVSFVMNNKVDGKDTYRVNKETAQRILEVADRLNYQPNNAARSLRSGKSNTIGVIVSDISNKFFADIARCIEDRAYKHKYTVLFGSTDENLKKLENLIAVFRNKGIDGLIIVPCDGAEQAILLVAQQDIPIVLLDREVPGAELNCVILNNLRAGIQATDALLRRGCRKIEMVSYSMHLSNIRDREEGYRTSMERAGLESECQIHRVRHDHLDRIAEIILSAKERGTEGLVFATNTLAIAGLREISHNGWRIPQDFAVATFDSNEAFDINNTDIAYVRQPIEQFGTEALDLLIKSIEKSDKPMSHTRIILTPELVESNKSAIDRKNPEPVSE